MKAYQVHSALHSSQQFDQLACMSGRVIETAKDDIFKTQPALVCPVSPLEQWKSSLEQFLNIHEVLPELPKKRGRKKQRSLIGQIGAGKDTHSGIIDIAIMQSLFEGEEKDVKPFVADYGMVIVDECHHVAVGATCICGAMWRKLCCKWW